MKKLSLVSVLFFVATLGFAPRAMALIPIPTFSPSEIAQQISNYMTTVNHYKMEVYNTKNLVMEGVLKGVPGYIRSIENKDYLGLVKGMATDGYNTYMADYAIRKKAKAEAQKEAQENAQQKLIDRQEGEEAAEEAIEKNREKAQTNKQNLAKKVFSWGKNAATTAGTWVNKNSDALNKINTGIGGSSTIGDGINTLGKLGKKTEKNTTPAESADVGRKPADNES